MKIGKIISVEYDKFKVRLFHTTRNSSVTINGQVYYFGNIGSYLKTKNSSGELIVCEICAIVDWVNKEAQAYSNYNLDTSKEIVIKPIGTLKGETFSMGVGIFPSLYSDVEIVTFEDLDCILSSADVGLGKGIHKCISIGHSKSLINYEIKLDINRLFNIHTAVLGNSGSGKSHTIAHILHEIYRKSNNHAGGAKTILFDANGEYPLAFKKKAMHNLVDAIFYKPNIQKEEGAYTPFYLPYYLMNLDEWLAFLLASERTQKPFWDKVLQECYKFHKIFTDKNNASCFVNYIKWKLTQILHIILTRIESDTSKITAAKGAIAKIHSICTSISEKRKDKETDEYIKDLKNFLKVCDLLCYVNYGYNHDAVINALPSFLQREGAKKYVLIKNPNDKPKLVDSFESDSFLQINENDALKVEEEKLKSGEYFDYSYLRVAVDMVLLEEEARGNLHIRDFVSTLLTRLDFFLNNSECDFMRNSNDYTNSDDYLEKVFGISGEGTLSKQLITIDSSEVGTDVLELMTSVISRMIFDFRKHRIGEERRKRPVHIILDEAHRYIRKDAVYIIRENIFEKIAREGRKYSLYLIVSSQRPSELSQTVLSQCGNYIVHRIQNEVDMKYIYSVLPYFSEDFINKIKQAVPGEALIFGNCVPMPIMIKVTKAEPAPNSGNCIINKEWFRWGSEQNN